MHNHLATLRRIRASVASLCLMLVTALATSQTLAQSQMPAIEPPADWHFRYDLFKMSLEKSGLEIQGIDAVKNLPSQSVIVHLGGVPSRSVSSFFNSFIQRGGAVLIATDQPTFTALGNVRGRIVQTEDSSAAYQGQRDCIRVSPDRPSPLTQNANELIFNRASYIGQLDARNFSWQTDVRWPNNVRREFAGQIVVASTETPSGGRAILCADHSIFTNGMLWHADNAMFVLNVTNWLSGTDRDTLYFSVDGSSQESYEEELKQLLASAPLPDVNINQTPELEIEQMLRVANTVVANAEDANLLNAYLEDRPRRMSERHYLRSILFAIAAAIGCMAVYQLTQRGARSSKPPAPPPKRALAAAVQPTNKAPAVRRGEAAVLLCRDTLRQLTGSDNPQSWEGLPADSATARQQLSRVVSVATQPPLQLATADLLEIDSVCRDLVHNYSSNN